MQRWPVAFAAVVALGAISAHAQGTAADYDRALALRDRWQYLTGKAAARCR
jgi:hypothetical protein